MRIYKQYFNKSGILAVALGAAVFAPGARAQKATYESFKTLQSRNIFDPDRSRDTGTQPARTRTQETRTAYVQQAPPKPSDYVELTGVMTTEEETFAFFAGSQRQYNKVVAVNGAIAGATITKITAAGIEVTRDGKQIAVPVGRTVPFDDSAPGLPPGTGTTTTYAPAAATVPAQTATTAPSVTGTTSGPALDPQTASQQVPVPDAISGTRRAPRRTVSATRCGA